MSLDASASKDPDSAIGTYAWSFGDGKSQLLSAPKTTHTFAKPGTYTVSLKETDAEGCSTRSIATGRSVVCNGLPSAQATKAIRVAFPGVKVSCPRRAKPKGCAFKLQVIAGKPKKGKAPKLESQVAKAKVKAGRSAIVSLKPMKAFATKLALARTVLVKEIISAAGKSKVRQVRLKIVR